MPAKNEEKENVLNLTTMPNSVEAEQNILCCILRDADMQAEIIAKLSPDDFYQTNHAKIFAVMQEVSVKSYTVGGVNKTNTVNLATVVDALRRNGTLAQVGDIDYIIKLNDLLPSTANYDEYLSIVKRASTMRKLIEICGKVTKKAYSSASAEEALTYAEEAIFALSEKGSNGGLTNLAVDAAITLQTICDRYVNPEKFRGVETGIRKLDRITNGLHGGELIVLAARPGVGKSALVMNIVEHVAKQGKTVAVYNLEMSKSQLVERMLSSMSGVPMQYIKSGQLPNGVNDLAKLRTAQEVISTMQLFCDDYVYIKASEIASQCRRLKARSGLDLIVIDYIQLMTGDFNDAKQGRQQEVAAISRALKLIAKELDVPVIALAQLKRDAEMRNIGKGGKNAGNGNTEPVLSDLRESGAIEQDADIVMFIHKSTEESGDPKYSLIVAKHRNGETCDIPMHWIGRIVRFVDEDTLNGIKGKETETDETQPAKTTEERREETVDLGADQTEKEFVFDGGEPAPEYESDGNESDSPTDDDEE